MLAMAKAEVAMRRVSGGRIARMAGLRVQTYNAEVAA